MKSALQIKCIIIIIITNMLFDVICSYYRKLVHFVDKANKKQKREKLSENEQL